MKRAIALSLALALCGTANAAANAEPAVSQDDCAQLHLIRGVTPLDSRTVVIYEGPGRKAYLAKLSAPLPELKFAFRYAYVDSDYDGRICGRSLDSIILPDEAIRIPARIISMTKLDDAGIQALEEQYDVKLTRKRKPKDQAQPEQTGEAPTVS